MSEVALCIVQDHDPWLLVLAVVTCLVGSTATAHLFARFRAMNSVRRYGWMMLCSVSAGTTVWCTHFIAMMAYITAAPVFLDPMLTLVSLLIAVCAAVPGIALASARRPAAGLCGGGIVGLAMSAMHYTGMRAYRIDGLVEWDWRYIAVSLVFAAVFSALAFHLLRRATHAALMGGALLFGLALVLLHFTGMTAMHVSVLDLHERGLGDTAMEALAIATSLAALLVVGCAVIAALIDRQGQEETFRRLRRMALHDPLTDLPNRARFNEELTDRLRHGERDSHLAVVMIDLSRFKSVNDIYGHQGGDQLLVALGARFAGALHDGERIARMGGDEFAALLSYDRREEVDAFLERVRGCLDEPFAFERFNVSVSANIGVALAPENGTDADVLMANADLAMYRGKAARSALPCFYDQTMDEAMRDRRALTSDLRAAIGTSQFVLHYQVQARIAEGEISGFEALVRWNHPTRGFVSPADFIPLAEESGQIIPLGSWILRQACFEAALWPNRHIISVNLSPLQLADPMLVDIVRDALNDSGLPPARLVLELTESAIIRDREFALKTLGALRDMGIALALDDFGIGYSSLDVLRAFPFDRIKLDASFVAEIERSEQAVAILNSVAVLGNSLKMPVLAEGIERPGQLRIVAQQGCSAIQGYLIGKPMRTLADPQMVRRAILNVVRGDGDVTMVA
ncbi:EAL domain-containing protein [Stakelama sp. CBK3Z-3]|uniref:EAL domain-containing protein n=1 Tax=Stakelama flava TaxID=2860338 RepID=A0ABS6XR75_9SPHN|nr:EAL domain-containing protein [Stakelama flava]MBW4331905.1 EAL domain-containing protein [Stakelama flava]